MAKTKILEVVKKKAQVAVENLKVGTTILDLHGEKVKVNKSLIDEMKEFEKLNPDSHAIWKEKVTGNFLLYKWILENPQEKKKSAKKPKAEEIEEEPEDIEVDDEEEDVEIEEIDELEEIEEAITEVNKLDEAIETESIDEESLLLDCIADYKSEFGVKTVKTNSKKFKQFYKRWQESE